MLSASRNPDAAAVAAWRLAAAAGAAFVVLFAGVALRRCGYPFELEWMEGATLEHVRRVAAGRPLYARPSIDFVAFTYPPLYYYVAAAMARIVGDGFVALRAVSIAASLGSILLVYAMVRPLADRPIPITAAGLFAASYALGGAWLDLGRVDALYLALALACGAVLASARAPLAFAAAGLLASLALLTKQTITVTLVFLVPYLLVRHWRGCAVFAVTVAAAGGGLELLLDHQSGGWFRYYVYELPRLRVAISARAGRWWLFLGPDLLRPWWPVLGASAVMMWSRRRGIAVPADRRLRVVLFAAGLILSSGLARLEGGAWTNALLPAYAAVPLLFGVAAAGVSRPAWLAPAAALLQCVLLAYDPRPLIPSARDRAAGDAIVDRLRALPNGTLVLDHGYLSAMAGKRTYAHGWAMTDVLWADYHGAGRALEAEMRAAIAAHRFPALVLDDTPQWFARDFTAAYARREELPEPQAFMPVSGSRRRPAAIYTPR